MGLMLVSFWERVFVAALQQVCIRHQPDYTNRFGREIRYASERFGFEYIAHCSIFENCSGVLVGAE